MKGPVYVLEFEIRISGKKPDKKMMAYARIYDEKQYSEIKEAIENGYYWIDDYKFYKAENK